MKVYVLTAGEYYDGSEVTAIYANKDQALKEAGDLAQKYANQIFKTSSDPRLSNPMKKTPIVFISEETATTCTYMLKDAENRKGIGEYGSDYYYFWQVKELELI